MNLNTFIFFFGYEKSSQEKKNIYLIENSQKIWET